MARIRKPGTRWRPGTIATRSGQNDGREMMLSMNGAIEGAVRRMLRAVASVASVRYEF